ncbi:MAG: M28 family peptidase [Bacteroidales bacterium]
MKIYLSILLSFICLSCSTCQNIPDYNRFSGAINQDSISSWITTLASPEFGGRHSGTAYEKISSAWIKQKMGLAGIGGGFPASTDPYAQKFSFLRNQPQQVFLLAGRDSLKQGRDFYISPLRHKRDSFQIIFGGTGSEKDLQSLDVQGKVVAIADWFTEDPAREQEEMQNLGEVISRLEKLNAAGICITYRDEVFRYIPKMELYNDILNTYLLPEANPAQVDSFLYILTRERLVNKFFGKPIQVPNRIILRSGSLLVPGKDERTWHLEARLKCDTVRAENIIGYIEGSRLKEEVIVISAHYDHLGKKGNEYFPGADDNASGVAALLSIARAFRMAVDMGYTPLRSVLFVAFSAEEQGEIGSAWYARHPIGRTVLNLNMDMIGRSDLNHTPAEPYVYYLTGKNQFSSFAPLMLDLAGTYAPSLQMDKRLNEDDFLDYYHRSDHLSFAVDSIPFVVFTTGEHADYHKTSDTYDKVEVRKVTQVARVVGAFAWKFAYGSTDPAKPLPAD